MLFRSVGPQPEQIEATSIWVLPNPSGLNAHYPPALLAREFARLRVAAGLPDRSGVGVLSAEPCSAEPE